MHSSHLFFCFLALNCHCVAAVMFISMRPTMAALSRHSRSWASALRAVIAMAFHARDGVVARSEQAETHRPQASRAPALGMNACFQSWANSFTLPIHERSARSDLGNTPSTNTSWGTRGRSALAPIAIDHRYEFAGRLLARCILGFRFVFHEVLRRVRKIRQRHSAPQCMPDIGRIDHPRPDLSLKLEVYAAPRAQHIDGRQLELACLRCRTPIQPRRCKVAA